MSCYETHRGVIRKVNTSPLSLKDYVVRLATENDVKEWWVRPVLEAKSPEEEEDALYELVYEIDKPKLMLINGELWEWVKHERLSDDIMEFCELTKLDDGTYNVFTQFYNGGCGVRDMVEDAFNKLNKK